MNICRICAKEMEEGYHDFCCCDCHKEDILNWDRKYGFTLKKEYNQK